MTRLNLDRRSWMKILTHVIVILMLFVLPEIISNISRPRLASSALSSFTIYFKALIYILVFYANYYLILTRTILTARRRILIFIACNFALVFIALGILYCVQRNDEGSPLNNPAMLFIGEKGQDKQPAADFRIDQRDESTAPRADNRPHDGIHPDDGQPRGRRDGRGPKPSDSVHPSLGDNGAPLFSEGERIPDGERGRNRELRNHKPQQRSDELRRRQINLTLSFLTREAVMLILIIALSVALRLGEKWSFLEKRQQELAASQKSEELASLKNQLNPHFLFNTLNTIYALIDISPDQAKEAVHQLSVLMRYVLYENPTKVRLSQEINFAKSYISLMKMRMGTNPIHAEFHEYPTDDVEVPPLIFISLIENAFKHGNTGDREQPIDISITSDADGTVTCRTSNYFREKISLPGSDQPADKPTDSTTDRPTNSRTDKPTGGDSEKNAGGIGIANLKRRLQLLYGPNATLRTTIDNNRYIALLTIHTL